MSEAALAAEPSGSEPVGREAELGVVEAWLAGAGGDSKPATGAPVLVIEGEPGIGKTTVWNEAISRAQLSGWTVLSCRSRRSDSALSHVGLTDLIGSVPDEVLNVLPSPQRRALAVAC